MTMPETMPQTKPALGPHPEKKPAERLEGFLRGIHADQGYGFIRPNNGEPDYWVNICQMRNRRHFVDGQVVDFVPGKNAKPGKAIPAFDVRALDGEPAAETARKPRKTAPVAKERRSAVAASFAPSSTRNGGTA
jgi:cold shock CspA family protein